MPRRDRNKRTDVWGISHRYYIIVIIGEMSRTASHYCDAIASARASSSVQAAMQYKDFDYSPFS